MELLKTRSKVYQKDKSHESSLNFDQWETFSEKYKSIRVFVYKITKNECHEQHFPEIIQTQLF